MSPYRESIDVIKKVEDTLRVLLETKATCLIHTDNPRRVAYSIRQAIHASSLYPEFEEFTILRDLYSFEVHPKFIRARFRGLDVIDHIEVHPDIEPADRSGRTLKDSEALVERGREIKGATDRMELPNLSTLSGIIEGVKRFGQRVLEVYLPDADLEKDDKARLYRWTSEKGWKIIDQEEAGLTLTRKEIPEEIEWVPEE